MVTSPLNAGLQISRLLRRPPNECVSAREKFVSTEHCSILPEFQVLLLLPLGYAAADALVPELKRKRIEEIIKFY